MFLYGFVGPWSQGSYQLPKIEKDWKLKKNLIHILYTTEVNHSEWTPLKAMVGLEGSDPASYLESGIFQGKTVNSLLNFGKEGNFFFYPT